MGLRLWLRSLSSMSLIMWLNVNDHCCLIFIPSNGRNLMCHIRTRGSVLLQRMWPTLKLHMLILRRCSPLQRHNGYQDKMVCRSGRLEWLSTFFEWWSQVVGQNGRQVNMQWRVRSLHQTVEGIKCKVGWRYGLRRESCHSLREGALKRWNHWPNCSHWLRAYLWSNKWAMNPDKLSKFSEHKFTTSTADQYLCQIIQEEMTWGLKHYMELELFPHIHLKVRKGISLNMAWHWMHKEGFCCTSYLKVLYYDGHDCPDVVEYQQNYFFPMLKKHEPWLVRHAAEDEDKEVVGKAPNYVECWLVLSPHDNTW